MKPMPAHWVVKLLSSHNNYYPLKVLMEHAIGEGMVLDIFKDLMLQTLSDADPRVPPIKKKLRLVCREEEEHIAWGEKETRRLLAEKPWLKTPYYGLLELQMSVLPLLVKAFEKRGGDHPVLKHLPGFLGHVQRRVYDQGKALGVPALAGARWRWGSGLPSSRGARWRGAIRSSRRSTSRSWASAEASPYFARGAAATSAHRPL